MRTCSIYIGISNKIKGVMVTASVSPLVDLGSILLSMEKKPTGLLGFFGEALIGIPPSLYGSQKRKDVAK